MAIKDRNGGVSWNEWEEPLKNKESQAIENAKAELSRQIAFTNFSNMNLTDSGNAFALMRTKTA